MRSVAEEYSPDAYENGVKKGAQQGVRDGVFNSLLAVLSNRLGPLRPSITSKLEGILDSNVLASLIPIAATAESWQEFEHGLNSVLDDSAN